MFRISIRELLVGMVTIAVAIAWVAEHKRLRAAFTEVEKAAEQVEEVTRQGEEWKRRSECLENQIQQIEKRLAAHGFELWWFGSAGPIVCKRDPDGTLVRFKEHGD